MLPAVDAFKSVMVQGRPATEELLTMTVLLFVSLRSTERSEVRLEG